MSSPQILWTETDTRGVEWVGYDDGTLSTIDGARGVRARGSFHGKRALQMTRHFIASARSADEVEYFYREARLQSKMGVEYNTEDGIARIIRAELSRGGVSA